MGAMRGRVVAWWTGAALAVACVVAVGGHPAPAVAAPPASLPVPSITGTPSPPPPAAPTRSGIGPASILTLYANKTADDAGADPGDCAAPRNPDCSLRAALALANANPGSTVNVATGIYTLTHAAASDATSGLVASAAMTIAGAGASGTIIEANAAPNTATYRVLRITGASVTVQGVTIRNGVVTVPTSGLDGGAGVRVDAVGSQITDSTISGNTANGTNTQILGGGIVVFGGGATLLRATVSGNTVNGTVTSGSWLAFGGGAAAVNGPLTVRESTLSGNVARGTVSGGTLNTGGGGLFNQNTLTVADSTIANNSATAGTSFGGGIANLATLTVTSSTLVGNSSTGSNVQGGGIHNQATVTFTNVIIANSTGGDLHTFGGSVTGDNNLFDDNSITPTGTGNIGNTPALLGVLGNYGGTTQTAPLLPGSPAINAGGAVGNGPSGNTVPATDQRGKSRVGAPDIGAFEAQGFTLTKQSGDGQAIPLSGASAALVVSLTPVNAGDPVAGGQVTFTIVPNAGAGATFGTLAGCTLGNGNLTAVCTITGTTATSPPLTTNGTAGGFTVTAAATGATTQTFHLANGTLTLVVNNAADGATDISRCAMGNANTCRLRDAIAAVTAGNNTITFAGAAFPAGTPATITLDQTAGTLVLTASTTIDGTGHMVVIDGGCTFDGRVCGADGVTVFAVNAGVTAHLTALTIQHGGVGVGGGIYNGGTLTVTNSTVSQNGNIGLSGGGAGFSGIYNDSGTLTVMNSTVSGNAAGSGGGIHNNGGTLTVMNSTIAGNEAFEGYGGGLYNDGGTLTVTNSTLTGNTTPGGGNGGGGIAITNGGTTTLTNTIVANTTSGGDLIAFSGSFNGDHNLIDDATSAGGFGDGTNGNVVGHSALLSTLGDYGGPTQTIPLLPGSLAINAGTAGAGIPTSDQRGVARLGVPDIGAFESQGFTMNRLLGDNQSAPPTGVFGTPLYVSFAPLNPGEPVDGGQVIFTVVPNAGAGATFGTGANCSLANGNLTAVCTVSSGRATSPPLTANSVEGTFTVTAAATGATTQTFHLTNIAITLVVNSAADGVATVANCATGNINTCRLRDALAGVTPSKYTITFTGAAFPASTPTTITLTANTLSLSTTVTVDGTGHMVVVNGGCTSCGIGGIPTDGVRVLVVQKRATVSLIGLTITGGNNSSGPSAGILNAGTLTLTNCTVRGNSAPNGDGGGIGNDGGTLTLIHSTVSGNSATRGGGGIFNYDFQASTGGIVTLVDSTVSGNRALFGGGIYNYNGLMTLVNSTVSSNTVSVQGGGIFNSPGGILALANSTVSGNTSTTEGGGMYFLSGTATLTNVTVSGNSASSGGGIFNSAGAVTRTNSIVAGNTQTSGGGDENSDGGGTFTGGNNVIGGDPMLAALGNNGGLTQTMLPRPTSPAVDAYAPTGGACGSYTDPITMVTTNITTDQRGVSRPQGAKCDIGAAEASANTPSLVAISPSSGTAAGSTRVTLTGAGFGTTPANVQVRVDGTAIPAASIISVAGTQIVYLAPAHNTGNATVTVTIGGVAASGSVTYTYGIVNPLPGGQPPSGGPSGNPAPLPGARPGGPPPGGGNPNPLPAPRP